VQAPVDIVLVALNPGAPLAGELDVYAEGGISRDSVPATDEQAALISATCLKQYSSPRRGANWIFHRKSVALARALLWLLDGSDPGRSPWTRCWFTDALKCSTQREQGPEITDAAFDNCQPFLVRELNVFAPKLIVALGGRAFGRLTALNRTNLVQFRHPSNGCPRLDADYHDQAFSRAAELLKVQLPRDFRAVRARVHNEAFE